MTSTCEQQTEGIFWIIEMSKFLQLIFTLIFIISSPVDSTSWMKILMKYFTQFFLLQFIYNEIEP